MRRVTNNPNGRPKQYMGISEVQLNTLQSQISILSNVLEQIDTTIKPLVRPEKLLPRKLKQVKVKVDELSEALVDTAKK